jgi:hypothetical protein
MTAALRRPEIAPEPHPPQTPDPERMPRAKLILVTPEMARRWLEKNALNRRLRPTFVQFLIEELQAGHWIMGNDGVSFDLDGWLTNGQHRLTSIARSGISAWLFVIIDLPAESRLIQDRGVVHSLADNLRLPVTEIADCTLIGQILGRFKGSRPSSFAMDRIAKWWDPIYQTIAPLTNRSRSGFSNSSLRVGVGLRWRIEADPAKVYVIQQYEYMLAGQAREMSEAVCTLWGRRMNSKKQGQGVRERIELACQAYRHFDRSREHVPTYIQNFDVVLNEMRTILLALEAEHEKTEPLQGNILESLALKTMRRPASASRPADTNIWQKNQKAARQRAERPAVVSALRVR